jgi:hypothetical protein
MKAGKEQVTKKNTENLPKSGKAIPAPLTMEVWKNCHDSVQEVNGEEDEGFKKNEKPKDILRQVLARKDSCLQKEGRYEA